MWGGDVWKQGGRERPLQEKQAAGSGGAVGGVRSARFWIDSEDKANRTCS